MLTWSVVYDTSRAVLSRTEFTKSFLFACFDVSAAVVQKSVDLLLAAYCLDVLSQPRCLPTAKT